MILVTGGSGFIGQRLIARLTSTGTSVRSLARGHRAAEVPEGVQVAKGDLTSGAALSRAVAGIEAVVHLVAIIREAEGQTFDAVIREGTERLVKEAASEGVKKFIYVSAIGARDDERYRYLYAKWQAEQAVISSGINYTIIRPSIVFGEDDEFINALAALVRNNPIVPVAGDGKSKFQPIWVEDLVTCIVACLDEEAHAGQVLEVGGPEHLTYDEMLNIIKEAMGKTRVTAHVPLALMRPVVQVLEWVLPKPPVTGEQLKMLALDNTAEIDSVTKAFGIQPRRLGDSLDYLSPQ